MPLSRKPLVALCIVSALLCACGGSGDSGGAGTSGSGSSGGGSGTGGGGSGGSGGGSGSTSPRAPAIPQITLSQGAGHPGETITMSAASSDPQDSPLTYSWAFGDGGTATGISVTHAYQSAGQFTPQVTVSNQFGLSSSASSLFPVTITARNPPNFLIYPTNSGHFLGDPLLVETTYLATDTNGLAITYTWSFGDGSTATGAKTSHVYAAPGTYPVTLRVTNTEGGASTAQMTAIVSARTPQPALVDDAFVPYCAGGFCAAASPGTYSGPGAGIWRYHNSTSTAATVDIHISGVRAGLSASLVFSNGSAVPAASLPGYGTSMSAATAQGANSRKQAQAGAGPGDTTVDPHTAILEQNLELARQLLRTPGRAKTGQPVGYATAVAASPPPTLGATRVWNDPFGIGGNDSYSMEVAATCSLPTGRNAIFWLDSAQLASGAITRARIQFMVDMLCGANGAYARQVALTGDVWGPAAEGTPYIKDGPDALQDLHIVMPGVPTNTPWGGYFTVVNLLPVADSPISNERLAIFVNPRHLVDHPTDSMPGSTMLHELKHLINFYQRVVVRNRAHATWLEETSAMLSEDLFTEMFLGYNRAEIRHDGYVFSGAGIAYIPWSFPDGHSYNQGGSFGSFLHRRYGLDVDRRLMDQCADNGSPVSSYQCVDALIRQWGGQGFADEFDRLGASVFGALGKGDFPLGFGFPAQLREGLLLKTFSSLSVTYAPAQITPRAITGLDATMHAYAFDIIATGQTTYRRDGVVVPPGTTLMLVISPP